MPFLATLAAVIICLALLGLLCVGLARALRLKCKVERNCFDRVSVIDGGADLAPWGDDGSRMSFYICYVRRLRDKS